jgi:CHAD domain-containing protein
MARARQISGIAPKDSYRSAALKMVAVRSRELFERHGEVLDVRDIEAVHDMRVATRRLRAALEMFELCFPRVAYRSVLRDVKKLADALGQRRDRDVQIERLERYGRALRGQERAAVAAFVKQLRAEQAQANRALAGALEALERSDLRSRLKELAQR